MRPLVRTASAKSPTFCPASAGSTSKRVNNRCAHRYEYTRRDVVLKPSLLGIEQKVRPEIIKATDPKNNTK